MKLIDVPFGVTDWAGLGPEEHKGSRGTSFWRTSERGNVRARVVEYTAGFESDHFCPRGHVVYVLEGEVVVRLADGTEHAVRAGKGFECSDDEKNPHRVSSPRGAKVFIVD